MCYPIADMNPFEKALFCHQESLPDILHTMSISMTRHPLITTDDKCHKASSKIRGSEPTKHDDAAKSASSDSVTLAFKSTNPHLLSGPPIFTFNGRVTLFVSVFTRLLFRRDYATIIPRHQKGRLISSQKSFFISLQHIRIPADVDQRKPPSPV
jgi:hypothetical protein